MSSTFTLVTLHLDLLRDREGYRLPGINLPIALTLLRATLLPAIVLFLAHRLFPLALGLFLLAALSDVLDGWLARRWNQVTQLGTVLAQQPSGGGSAPAYSQVTLTVGR